MKICVSAVANSLDAQLDPRFGRCPYFVIVDAGIKIVTGAFGTVRESVEKFKRGELRETGAPTVGGHFGMGIGRGRGRGRGQWGT